MGVRLPVEYQEVTCIIGQGAQYIDTGYVLNSGCRVQGRYNLYGTQTELRNVLSLFGARDSKYDNAFAMFNVTGAPRIDYGKTLTTHSFSYSTINSINVVDFDLNAGIATVNGRTHAFADSLKPFTCPSTALIFAVHTGNTVDTRYPRGEIVYLKITDENGIVVRDMVPCYRKSDNKPGMYDLVSKTFYTNQGTGEFLVGPDVVNHISPRLMDRRRALIAKLTSLFRKVITSQTGLATFDTNVAKPMKVTCEFSPKQDLHGYDNPWPDGGGVNIIPDGTDTANGYQGYRYLKSDNTYSDITSGWYVSEYFSIDSSRQYVWSAKGTLVNQAICFYDQNKSFLDGVSGSDVTLPYTFNPPQGAAYCRASQATAPGNLVQIEVGTTATTPILPYSNICPIEGWDGCKIVDIGYNLINLGVAEATPGALINGKRILEPYKYYPGFHGSSINYYARSYITDFNVDGQGCSFIISAGNYSVGITFLIKGGTRAKAILTGTNATIGYCDFFDKNWNNIGGSWGLPNGIDVPIGTVYGMARINPITDNQVTTVTNYTIAYESNSITPHQFHGTTIPITFNNPGTYDFLPIQEGTGDPSPENVRPITPGLTITRDDNTMLEVWGGSLTVNSDGTGSLEATYYNLDCKSIDWVSGNGATSDIVYFYNRRSADVPECLYSGGQLSLCKNVEKYSHGVINNPYDHKISCAWVFTTTARIGFGEESDIDTIEKFNTWLNDQEICQIVYPLKEPITYTLSVAETGRAFEALGLGKNLGPLYGGSVTINEDGSCDVVATAASIEYDGSSDEKWYEYGIGETHYCCIINPPNKLAGEQSSICNEFKNINAAYAISNYGIYSDHVNLPTVYFRMPNENITTKAEFLAWLAQNPIKLAYKLKTPQTYHFDNVGQLQSFLGINNIWSDLNGPITVEYYKKQL